MKGLTERKETGTKFLLVKYHCICEISKEPREGFDRHAEVFDGEEYVKYIKRYDLEGMITAIEWRDTKDQFKTRFMSWRVHVDAAGTPVVLEIPWKSNPSDRFMKVAENIDFTKPVEFRVWKDTKGKSDKTAFAIFQDGVNVQAKYRKGDMGDCPEAVEELDGWDFRPQLRFLHSQMLNVVIPRVTAANEIAKSQQQEPAHGDAWEDDGTADF